jgi:hypothetical protein
MGVHSNNQHPRSWLESLEFEDKFYFRKLNSTAKKWNKQGRAYSESAKVKLDDITP